ncbi:MAG TPA: pyridoxamine 5'-phosphate oxidase [Gemmatimonadaceae bacterium]|jgi:pyridoxamine 5'-phosphate oxidase|nr:pyridoxamine 5'-phosphate oxidase [Gemmatimonadaceae bacterium]
MMDGVEAGRDPFERFRTLLEVAKALPRDRLPEPTAFALATVDVSGRPSVRIVLLKHVDERGFVFYTNYESRKGRELLATKRAAMCFHWQPLEEQVRVEGVAEPVSAEEADEYFASRARGSQLGAWSSIQSTPMENPGDLDARLAEMEKRFAGGAVPRPPHWSGFRVVPEVIEFWKNMPSRLHVRHLYTRKGGEWEVGRLYP